MEKAFENSISGRLTPAIGLLQTVKVKTTFAAGGPFKWEHGSTLNFDAAIPAPQTGEAVAEAKALSMKASFEELYGSEYTVERATAAA